MAKWIKAHVALLGTDTDRSVAKKVGREVATVASARIRRGIPSFQKQEPWTDANIAMLGSMPDPVVAARVKRSKESVAAARRARGIAGYAPPVNDWGVVELEYKRGTAVSEISRITRVSTKTIYKRAKRFGWQRPNLQPAKRRFSVFDRMAVDLLHRRMDDLMYSMLTGGDVFP